MRCNFDFQWFFFFTLRNGSDLHNSHETFFSPSVRHCQTRDRDDFIIHAQTNDDQFRPFLKNFNSNCNEKKIFRRNQLGRSEKRATRRQGAHLCAPVRGSDTDLVKQLHSLRFLMISFLRGDDMRLHTRVHLFRAGENFNYICFDLYWKANELVNVNCFKPLKKFKYSRKFKCFYTNR